MNFQLIQNEILKKNNFTPYYPQNNFVLNIGTDMNVFPYTRFFRGKQNELNPSFFSREAGYSPLCYETKKSNVTNQNLLLANTCFQMPCSTILPCQYKTFQSNTNQCVFYSP